MQAHERVDIKFTGQIELFLNIAQGIDITGKQRTINFIRDFADPIEGDIHIHAATRNTSADLAFDYDFE